MHNFLLAMWHWMSTAGFAGLFAAVAAGLALTGVMKTAKATQKAADTNAAATRDAARTAAENQWRITARDRWWENSRWAIELLAGDAASFNVGYAAVLALVQDSDAQEHEIDMLTAVGASYSLDQSGTLGLDDEQEVTTNGQDD
ncbi:hypothetical protein Back2_02300 [Nocardioides baekrokdamisoli]|uniref:Uncharacterized protein n=1 Tax=Nocardioides baekrokdamisoli TaxID=1804624 RepID=A0A3G9IUQ0_9ACTN|nr:hypothetical protein [Nocardioides baekrokdamisoli]BBH15943.1 hypothetical protein Back2_02300 [Nocardioides baekrokdamisoli]